MTTSPPKTALPDLPQSRYELVARIAAGGMATVYVGRLRGAAGFWRLCAIKRAHAHLVEDESAHEVLVTEARLASGVNHPHVVSVFDVEELDGELLLVMEYVEGATLSELCQSADMKSEVVPPAVALRIAIDACAGLHAAHEVRDEHGLRLGLVHRDVSPQNILVGLDGVSRITDFGIAKVRTGDAMVRTATGHLKGKIGYMAPEYIRGQNLDRRSDEFSLAVVVWEALTGQRLFRGGNELETMMRAINAPVPPLSRYVEGADGELDMIFERALQRSPEARYRTLVDFQSALELWAGTAGMLASRTAVAHYVEQQAGEKLAARRALVRRRLADLDGGEGQSKSGKRLIREIPPATGSETTTNAVAPLIQTRRGTSRAALIGLVGAVIGAATVLVVQSRNEQPAPAAETAPEVSAAPAASSATPPSASVSTVAPVQSSVDAGAPPVHRPLVRPLPKAPPKAGATPDPNPYGP